MLMFICICICMCLNTVSNVFMFSICIKCPWASHISKGESPGLGASLTAFSPVVFSQNRSKDSLQDPQASARETC